MSLDKRQKSIYLSLISLRSHAGWGTTFTIIVPVIADNKTKKIAKNNPKTVEKNKSSVRILVMEDEYAVRILTSKLLESWGYEVMATDSAQQALEQLDSTGFMPTLIISDYHLDDQTGIDAINKVQSHMNKTFPGMLVTGNRDQSVISEAESLGYKVLHKPVKPEYLHELVKSCVQELAINSGDFQPIKS